MEQVGSLIVRVTTSRAQLPVEDASVIVTAPSDGPLPRVMAVLETNESGVAGPIRLPAPTTPSSGTSPGGPTPYNMYSLWVEHPGYEVVLVRSLQIFPNVQTVQTITLVPLSGTQRPGTDFGGPDSAASQSL